MKTEKKQVRRIASSIYWGIVLIAIAVLLLLKAAGLEFGQIADLSIVDLLLSAVVLSFVIYSCASLHFPALPFELAVLFMLFENEIAAALGREESNIVSNWLLLGCALLCSIGIGLIQGIAHPTNIRVTATDGDSMFGSDTRYFDCRENSQFFYRTKMGDGNIYFNNPEKFTGGTLALECKMGNMTVRVPSSWRIENHIQNKMGNVDVCGSGTSDGPLLTLTGICSMGNITIRFC